jgi:hypothetical protein
MLYYTFVINKLAINVISLPMYTVFGNTHYKGQHMESLFKLLTPENTADILNVSVRTLANWRCMGEGPAYIKIGKSVRYALEDVKEFIAKGRVA